VDDGTAGDLPYSRPSVVLGMFTSIDPLSAGTLVDASLESLKEASRECLREKGLEEPCDITCCLMLLQWDELGKLSSFLCVFS